MSMAQAVPISSKTTEVNMPIRPAWWGTWRRFARNKPALLGLVVVFLLVVVGLFGPFLTPYSYSDQNLDNVTQPPTAAHLLGTDDLGRDMFTRMIYGTRSVLFVIVVVTLLDLGLGIPLGAAAGYFGGWVDTFVMRLSDFLFAFPGLLFVFFVAATIKPGIISWMKAEGWRGFVDTGYADYLVVMISLGVVGWAGLARLVRGQVLSVREKEFVLAARAIGLPSWRIILKYLLPNSLSPVLVAISMGMGGIALSESILSYLGIGLQASPSWGNIIADNAPIHWRDWPAMLWLVLTPGLVLAIVVFAFNFLGDGLNEALNPEVY
jgi:peptide/nickel transport system permease protein